MQFAQIYTPGIAQCSYVIGSGKANAWWWTRSAM
jgi:hypothetical protein